MSVQNLKTIVSLIQQHVTDARRQLDELNSSSLWAAGHKESETARIVADLQTRVDDLRSQAGQALEAARSAVETEFYRSVMLAGPQGAEWQEAAARFQLISGDVSGMTPAEILDYYRLASSAGDKLGAWAIQRAGLHHLDRLGRDTVDLLGAAHARQAGDQLHHLAFGEAYGRRKASMAELAGLEMELKRPQTPTEQAEYQKGIADSFGVNPDLVPVE